MMKNLRNVFVDLIENIVNITQKYHDFCNFACVGCASLGCRRAGFAAPCAQTSKRITPNQRYHQAAAPHKRFRVPHAAGCAWRCRFCPDMPWYNRHILAHKNLNTHQFCHRAHRAHRPSLTPQSPSSSSITSQRPSSPSLTSQRPSSSLSTSQSSITSQSPSSSLITS